MDVRKSFTGEELIRKADRSDMLKHFSILTIVAIVVISASIYIKMFVELKTSIYEFLLIMSFVACGLLFACVLKYIFKYFIKGEEYEFYVYYGCGKSGVVHGEQLGLPNKFNNLTPQENDELERCIYHPHRYKGPTNATGKNPTSISVYITFIFIFVCIIGSVVAYMKDYLDEMGHTSESYTLAAVGSLGSLFFIVPLAIVFIMIVKPYSSKKKQSGYNPLEDESSKYKIKNK